MKFLKNFKIAVALALALIFTLQLPMNAFASSDGASDSTSGGGVYVSEVYVAYGNNAEEASAALQSKGFVPVDGNLNDGGSTYAMLGYKTTSDIRDSITDLAVMNMRGGYSVEDYKTALESKKNDIAEFLSEFMAVIREYRANLAAGKSRAVYVHDLLNKYTDDDTGMAMGDLLNSETFQDRIGVMESVGTENTENLPDLVTILLQGNTQVIRSMELLLSMAADASDNRWVDRFAELDYDTMLDQLEEQQPDLNTETKRQQFLDNIYGNYAEAVAADMAAIRTKLLAYQESPLKLETATEEDIKNAFGDPDALEGEAALNSITASEQWIENGSLYENLKTFEGGRFKQGELLEFFLQETSGDDTERIYPVIAALSEGQRYGLPFVSFARIINNSFISDEDWKNQADNVNTMVGELETVSVYANIDRNIYKEDGSVAMTDAAIREENTATGTTGTAFEKMDTLSKITVISWVATAVGLTATVVSRVAAGVLYSKMVSADALVRNVTSMEKLSQMTQEIGYANVAYYTARDVFAYIGYATIAIGLISATLTVIDLLRDHSVEQLPIPKYIVDYCADADGDFYSLNYKAAECNREEFFGTGYTRQKGSSADLMADEGQQWLVLYASKNSKAGNPLTPEFIVQNSDQAPSGLDGSVHLIGEKGAVNIVSGTFKNYSTFSQTWQAITGDNTLYLFYKYSSDVKTYDESAGNMTASAVGSGTSVIFGVIGLVVGAAIGIIITNIVRKRKKPSEA